jgi:hypothetical protein
MAFEYYWNRDKIIPIPELDISLVPIEHILMKDTRFQRQDAQY